MEYGVFGRLTIGNVNVFTGTGNVTILGEGAVVVKKSVGAATGVTLPVKPTRGDTLYVQDGKGDAGTNNITVSTPDGSTINGASTYVLSTNYKRVHFLWSGTEWFASL